MTTQPSRLSRIDTPWSILRKAHDGSDHSIQWARQALFDRYGGAVRRYLRAALRNEEAADEVGQEFALRLIRGDFRNANPERGRFRSFVKTALHNLVVDFHRRAGRNARPPLDEAAAEVEEPQAQESLFLQSWSQELLDRSWASLRELERDRGAPYYAALRMLVDDPTLSSHDVAQRLSQQLGGDFTAGNVRVVIHRARQMFADQLVAEVGDSLESTTRDEIEQELGELNLLRYCKSALDRHFPESATDGGGKEADGP